MDFSKYSKVSKHHYLDEKLNLTTLIFCVIAIKFFIFLIDPNVMFFLGDSESYIHTARTSWIPPDRSFVYGFLIRIIAVSTHSLGALVVFQILLSAFTAVLVSYCLVKFLDTALWIGNLMGLLCAIDPLQLLYERYVMTETVSLFLFSGYMLLSFKYLRSEKLFSLILVQVMGILLVSLRIGFLPLVLVNAIVLPMLISPLFSTNEVADPPPPPRRWGGRRLFKLLSFKMIVHLLLSVLTTLIVNGGYRAFNGQISHNPPAYQYRSGFFLLGVWCPVVKPVDFPVRDRVEKIFGSLRFDLTNRRARTMQRWSPGGLIQTIKKEFHDILEAERLSRQTAINCLKRDPVGILRLGVASFCDYWDLDYLRRCMVADRGGDRPLPGRMIEILKENFGLSAENLPFKRTLTNIYFFVAWPFYLFLLWLPVLAFLVLPFLSRKHMKFVFVIFLASVEIVCVSCFLIERPTPRYLHPAGWLSFLVLGVILNLVMTRTQIVRKRRESQINPQRSFAFDDGKQ